MFSAFLSQLPSTRIPEFSEKCSTFFNLNKLTMGAAPARTFLGHQRL
jgi:hypothetical protein